MLLGARQAGASTEEVQIRDYHIEPCIGCERCRKDELCTGIFDGMQLLYPKIIQSEGLIIISPVHNYNMTAILKAFIDRLYCFYYFGEERPGYWKSQLADKGKKAVIAVIGEQKDEEEGGINLTLTTLSLPIKALGYKIVNQISVPGVFPKGKIKDDLHILDKAEAVGKHLAASLAL
jgi:multimeric flavodoxin WrbA